jgi:hypothetical protein
MPKLNHALRKQDKFLVLGQDSKLSYGFALSIVYEAPAFQKIRGEERHLEKDIVLL